MKVISLTEPMATLIAQGHKKIETRSWKTKYRGEIYIHASLTKIRKEWKNNEKIMSLLDNDKLHYGEIICKCNSFKGNMPEEVVRAFKEDTRLELTDIIDQR